jgi:hypothetical protein
MAVFFFTICVNYRLSAIGREWWKDREGGPEMSAG